MPVIKDPYLKPGTPVSFVFGKCDRKQVIAAVIVATVPSSCCVRDLKPFYPTIRKLLVKAASGKATLLFNPDKRESRVRYLLREINLSTVYRKPDSYYLVPVESVTVSD